MSRSIPAPTSAIAELKQAIRAVGLRSTSPRISVLKALRVAQAPISHAELYEKLQGEGMDRTTVYRNLLDLTDAGLVERTDLGDHVWRFELKRDKGVHRQSHAHFTCTDCGTVECLDAVDFKVKAPNAPRAVAKRQVDVQLRGLCDDCA
jgi:Fur family transcriptional regulator, ferric uptake regulator